MMELEDIKNLDMSALLDMLSRSTEDAIRLLRERNTGTAYYEAKAGIKLLTAEIERRKLAGNNHDTTSIKAE
jgi:hypothetical protein